MLTIFPVARLMGLGPIESVVMLLILLILFSGYSLVGNRSSRDDRGGLTRRETQILISIGIALAVSVGVLLWDALAH